MSDAIRVNGNQFSWGSISVKVNGEKFYGFTSIGYGDSRERVMAYGMNRSHAPRGRSSGKYATEPVTITGWKDSMAKLRQALAQAGDGVSYGNTICQIVVQYVEGTNDPVTVELDDCVWTKSTSTDEESADPLKEEAEFSCMRIRRNGLTLYGAETT